MVALAVQRHAEINIRVRRAPGAGFSSAAASFALRADPAPCACRRLLGAHPYVFITPAPPAAIPGSATTSCTANCACPTPNAAFHHPPCLGRRRRTAHPVAKPPRPGRFERTLLPGPASGRFGTARNRRYCAILALRHNCQYFVDFGFTCRNVLRGGLLVAAPLLLLIDSQAAPAYFDQHSRARERPPHYLVELIPKIGADQAEGRIVVFPGGPGPIGEMLSNNVDFAVVGLPRRHVGTPHRPSRRRPGRHQRPAARVLLVRQGLKGQVKSIADLKGRTIGLHSNSTATKAPRSRFWN